MLFVLTSVNAAYSRLVSGLKEQKIKHEEIHMAAPSEMYQCQTVNCGYIYNPDKGDRKGKISKGTSFDDLPDDWKCPVCGATKKMFKPLG